jgi:hypothetical protein
VGFVLENAQTHAGFANSDSIRLYGFDSIHVHQVEDDSAVEWNSLAVIACPCPAGCDSDISSMAVPEHFLYLLLSERLNDDLTDFTVELLAEHRRVPVEVARELFDDAWIGYYARPFAEDGRQGSDIR